jgi:hypothetical protein
MNDMVVPCLCDDADIADTTGDQRMEVGIACDLSIGSPGRSKGDKLGRVQTKL